MTEERINKTLNNGNFYGRILKRILNIALSNSFLQYARRENTIWDLTLTLVTQYFYKNRNYTDPKSIIDTKSWAVIMFYQRKVTLTEG